MGLGPLADRHGALRVLEPRASWAASPRHREAEWAYGVSGVRTGVRRLAVWAATSLEFRLHQVPPPTLLRANGRATARWLDNVNTDFDYRNYNVNITMDHNTNAAQGRPPGGGVHT